MLTSILEFLGYNLTRLEEYEPPRGRAFLCFTLMRALATKIDTRPWAKQLPLHRLIIDVIRLGDPHVAEQTLNHATNSFLEAPLIVLAH